MSIYEASIIDPKKQVEFYKDLSEQLQCENKKLNGAIQTYDILLKANVEENKQLKEVINKLRNKIKLVKECGFDKVGRYELLDILKEVK